MIFYIEYSREQQKTLSYLKFADSDRAIAQAHALKREIELTRLPGGLKLEIVMLEAPLESTIRNTHPRYFGNPFAPEMQDFWRNMPVFSEKLDAQPQLIFPARAVRQP
jgi:hypothetical protein